MSLGRMPTAWSRTALPVAVSMTLTLRLPQFET